MGFIKNQLPKVIEWTDDSKDIMVYRYPMDGREIMKGSQLTVRESQTAVVVDQGKIADIFAAGRFKLDSANLPILTKLRSWKYGFDSPFKVDIYFVNTKQFIGQKWGTVNPIAMRDSDFGMIRIRGFGTYSFRVSNAELFLKEVFGTNSKYKTEDVNEYLKSMIISVATDTIVGSKISALDLAGNIRGFNELVKNQLQEKFSGLGLLLTNMVIENLSFPEAVEKMLDERTNVGMMSDKMGSYVQMKTVEALGKAAENQGSMGGFMGMGIGMGMGGMGAGGAGASPFGALGNAQDAPKTTGGNNGGQGGAGGTAGAAGTKFCPDCGTVVLSNARFCPGCGKGFAQAGGNVCSCGAALTAGEKFCSACGKKV
jgi:membrane protease subunit (stomatin/prohibitin family)